MNTKLKNQKSATKGKPTNINMNQESLNLVSQATVRTVLITSKGPNFKGQGVLIDNGLILTAETCVAYDSLAITNFAEGYESTQKIVTSRGQSLQATPLMIDPVSGIALLGPVDVDYIPTLAMEVESFIRKTIPVPLFRGRLSTVPLPIRIKNRLGIWVPGHVTRQASWPHRVLLSTREKTTNLIAGSPVVTEEGKLFGVVPRFIDEYETPQGCEAFMAIAHLALPRWATRQNYERRLKRCLQKKVPGIIAAKAPTTGPR